jgi:hypothetical protein
MADQKPQVSGFMLSNGAFILGIREEEECNGPYQALDTPVQIVAQGNAMGFAALTPFAKDESLFTLYDNHVMGEFIPSHPVSEEYHKYYAKVNSNIDLPPSQGIVLPGQQ